MNKRQAKKHKQKQSLIAADYKTDRFYLRKMQDDNAVYMRKRRNGSLKHEDYEDLIFIGVFTEEEVAKILTPPPQRIRCRQLEKAQRKKR